MMDLRAANVRRDGALVRFLIASDGAAMRWTATPDLRPEIIDRLRVAGFRMSEHGFFIFWRMVARDRYVFVAFNEDGSGLMRSQISGRKVSRVTVFRDLAELDIALLYHSLWQRVRWWRWLWVGDRYE